MKAPRTSVTALYAVTVCVIGTHKTSLNRELYTHRHTNVSVGSLLTDTQGHLIFTDPNRQQRPQRETRRDKREVGDRLRRGRHIWSPAAGGPLPIRGFPTLRHTQDTDHLSSDLILSHLEALSRDHVEPLVRRQKLPKWVKITSQFQHDEYQLLI